MRKSFRARILISFLSVLLGTVGILSFVFAILTARYKRTEIESRFRVIAQTISSANFPLNASVLAQISRLIGAEVLLERADGSIVFESQPGLPRLFQSQEESVTAEPDGISQTSAGGFLCTSIGLRPHQSGERLSLHLFFLEAELAKLRWQALLPALGVGSGACVISFALAFWLSASLSRPIAQLRKRTEQIAQGDFRLMPISNRDEELRDLELSLNQMARQLADFAGEIRQTERLRVLGLMGGGLAHQLRNAATGARLAIGIHQERCQSSPQLAESLEVALRQLRLMEKYIKSFLSLSVDEQLSPETLDLHAVAASVVAMVGPAAAHASVDVVLEKQVGLARMIADADRIEQMLMNLVLNGIEAATPLSKESGAEGGRGEVCIAIETVDGRALRLTVADNGSGPPEEFSPTMFEPFATSKRNGVGLGLTIVRRVVEQHGGRIEWVRRNKRTEFVVELPCDHFQTDATVNQKP